MLRDDVETGVPFEPYGNDLALEILTSLPPVLIAVGHSQDIVPDTAVTI